MTLSLPSSRSPPPEISIGRSHPSLAGFTELGEAGMDRAGVVCRIGVLGPKVLSAEAMGKGGNISNQAEMIKAGFREEGDTLSKDRGFGSSEGLGKEVNNRMGWVDCLGVSVGRGGLEALTDLHHANYVVLFQPDL